VNPFFKSAKVKIDLQKANHLLANSIPKNQVPQLDSPLKHEMQKQNSELKAYKNGQKRAETELAKAKAEKRAANDEIKELKLKLSEKDGIILGYGHNFQAESFEFIRNIYGG